MAPPLQGFNHRAPGTAHHDVFFDGHEQVMRVSELHDELLIERFDVAHVGDGRIELVGGLPSRLDH